MKRPGIAGQCENKLFAGLSQLKSKMWPPGEAFVVVATLLYSGIFLAGLIGNSFIIITVLRWKEMKTPCNLLVMNIAIADLAVAVIAAPLRILEIHYHWPFGDFMCKFLAPLQDVFVCVSVVTHTTIALERYRAIVKSMMNKISVSVTKAVICVSWFGCYFTAALPIAIISRTEEQNSQVFCTISFPSTTFRRVYVICLVVLFIILPVAVQTWAYCCMNKVVSMDVFHRFRIRSKERREKNPITDLNLKVYLHSEVTHERVKRSFDLARTKRKSNLLKMLVTLVVVFQVCYIPRGILMIMNEFGDFSWSSAFIYIDMAALILYYIKHVLNPLIIFTSSTDFRSRFKKLGAEMRGKSRQVTTTV